MKTALAGAQPVPLPGSEGWRPATESPKVASASRTGSLAPRTVASAPQDSLTGFLSRLFGP
jgi:hypothetical protein